MDDKTRKQIIGTKALQFAHATEMSYGEAVKAIEYILSKGRRIGSITVEEIQKAKSEAEVKSLGEVTVDFTTGEISYSETEVT